MGWKETLTEGAKNFMGSDLGKELTDKAREIAKEKLDNALGGQPAEGGAADAASGGDDGKKPGDRP